MDGTRLGSAHDRPVGTDVCGPPLLRIDQLRAGCDHSAFDESSERNARLVALVGHGLHRTFVERQGRIDPFARHFHISRFALYPDPPAAEATRYCASRPSAEERVE